MNMYSTLLLSVLFGAVSVRSDNNPSMPRLCQLLLYSRTLCPTPSVVKEDLICFIPRENTNATKYENLTVSACRRWTYVTFTNFHGQKCLQVQSKNNQTPNESMAERADIAYGGNIATPKPSLTRDPLCTNLGVLHTACKEGKLGEIRCILSQDPSAINYRDKKGRTPVMLAAMNGQGAVFDFLVSRGCDLSAVDEKNDTVLHLVCEEGYPDIAKRLLAIDKSNIEATGYRLMTPVMRAAYSGEKEIFYLLVNERCDLTRVDTYNNGVLHAVCFGGVVDLVQFVLSNNICDIESLGRHNRTPVMTAVREGHLDVLQFLQSKGCNLRAVDDEGNSVLHMACIGGHVHVLKYILSLKVYGIESKGFMGRTPVMLAAEFGHRKLFDFLVNEGCNVQVADKEGNNLYHLASVGQHMEMVKYLMRLGGGGDTAKNKQGDTPADIAELTGNMEIAALLRAKTQKKGRSRSYLINL